MNVNSSKPWWVPDIQSFIAAFLVVSVVAMTFALLIAPPSPDNTLLNTVIGGLMTVGFASVISFYYGSSKSSDKKDDVVSSIATSDLPKTPAVAPVDPNP